MGYLNDVVISLKAKETNKLRFISPDKLPKLIRQELDAEYPEGPEGEGFYVLKLNGVKWYSGFPDVQEVEDYLNKLDDEDYAFHRLGEEFGDYENRGSLDDEIYPCQSLEEYRYAPCNL